MSNAAAKTKLHVPSGDGRDYSVFIEDGYVVFQENGDSERDGGRLYLDLEVLKEGVRLIDVYSELSASMGTKDGQIH